MIAAVILAAGESRRLGQPKQLLELDGVSFVRRVAMAAIDAGCSPVVVVEGAVPLAHPLSSLTVTRVSNPAWRTGPGASIRAGVANLAGCDLDGVLLGVCDQPMLNAAVLRRLIDAWRGADRPIAACEYAGTRGTPCVFSRTLFQTLLALPDASGAKSMLSESTEITTLPWPGGAIDIDTPADLKSIHSAVMDLPPV